MDTIDIFYLVFAWHLFLVIFGDAKYFYSSVIIASAVFINLLLVDAPYIKEFISWMGYVEKRELWLRLSGLAAILLSLIPVHRDIALKHSLILIFAVLCHFGIIWELTKTSNFASYFVYEYYKQLIYSVGIMQMLVTLNGFTRAFIGILDALSNVVFRRFRFHQSYLLHQRSKGKT